VKYLEIIDGNGTEVSGTFDEALDLANFWKEPAMV
jgi:TPP-dependent pyruvate/acetoin dehydrogenase alpha subunit